MLTDDEMSKLIEIGYNGKDCLRAFLREAFDLEFTTEPYMGNSTLLNGIFIREGEVVSDNTWLPEDEAYGADTAEEAFMMSITAVIEYCIDLYNQSNVMAFRSVKYLV
jgi:hypothetical protein